MSKRNIFHEYLGYRPSFVAIICNFLPTKKSTFPVVKLLVFAPLVMLLWQQVTNSRRFSKSQAHMDTRRAQFKTNTNKLLPWLLFSCLRASSFVFLTWFIRLLVAHSFVSNDGKHFRIVWCRVVFDSFHAKWIVREKALGAYIRVTLNKWKTILRFSNRNPSWIGQRWAD